MSKSKQEIGARIKAQRKAIRMTQEQAAERLNISVKHFSEAERGVAGLSVENLAKLSDILGVSLDYLIKGVPDSEPWETVCRSITRLPEDKARLLCEIVRVCTQALLDGSRAEPPDPT